MKLRQFAGLVVLAGCSHLLFPWAGLAQEPGSSMPWKRAGVVFGADIPTSNTDLKIESRSIGLGTTIDLEDELGLDETRLTFRIGAFWRFFPRHRIDLSYYDLSRSGSRTLSQTLRVGDKIFLLASNVKTDDDFKMYQASYGYSFWQDQSIDLAASLGLYLLDFDFTLSASNVGSVSVDTIVPVPVIGLKGSYAIREDLFFHAGVHLMFADFDYGDFDLKGRLFDAMVRLEYDILEHVSLGLGYNFNLINIEFDDNDNRAAVDLQWGAVMLYLKLFI